MFGSCSIAEGTVLAGMLISSAASGVSVDEPHVYLMCNATSYNQEAASELLQSADDGGKLTLLINVTEPWMVTAGDECRILGSPAANDWQYITHYGLRDAPIALSNSTRYLHQTAAPAPFILRYPAIGRFRFTLNRSSGCFSFTADHG